MTVRRGYVDTPLGQLHYAEFGTEGIPVIGLHQTPRSHDEFLDMLPLVGRSHRFIAMDMYGFGMSAKPEGDQTIEQYASGVMALADALGLDRFAVLGHHTGGVVAVEVAAAAPERVSAALLSSASMTGPEYRARQASGGVGVDNAPIGEAGEHLTTWWAQRATWYPPSRADLLNRFTRDALAPGVDPLEGHIACGRYIMEDRIGLITAPVLLIGADADPFAFPDTEPLRAALTGSSRVEIEVIEGGTVALPEQNPVEVSEAVVRFLDTITA